jgi:hypothetical protein
MPEKVSGKDGDGATIKDVVITLTDSRKKKKGGFFFDIYMLQNVMI